MSALTAPPSIVQEFARVLLDLEMLADGAVTAWNKSGGPSGEPDDRMVAMADRGENPPHIYYRILFDKQWGDFGRRAVLNEAKDELKHWKGWDRPKFDTEDERTFEEVVVEDAEGWDARIAAQHFNIHVNYLRRIRAKAERDVEHGREPVPMPKVDQSALAERAREMRDRKVSTRQIAVSLGVHQTQVMRWIRDAA